MPTTREFIAGILFVLSLTLLSCSEQRKKRATTTTTDTMNAQMIESIENFKKRQIHSNLTAEIIDTTPDSMLLQTVFDQLSTKLPEDYQKEYQTVTNWTKPQQAIYIIWVLEAEVNNGGFNQFYFNSSGQFADLTVDALTRVGAKKFADLAASANEIYKANKEEIARHQDGTMEGFSESYEDNPLNKLDDEFYDLSSKENLQKRQIAYVRSHKEYFIDK
ncbi:DMP19 family protein [Spirosoma spitsbergense]|uniref:DMP19 family protein n=1 Tax=Spirosoma spitsbergense TaxID=431554 RepID=UPI000475A2D2|nr:DMP19 family protein [Spirosoma spitsbergense]